MGTPNEYPQHPDLRVSTLEHALVAQRFELVTERIDNVKARVIALEQANAQTAVLISELRTDMAEQMHGLRDDVAEQLKPVALYLAHEEIENAERTEHAARFSMRMQIWLGVITLLITAIGLVGTVIVVFGRY